jgi:hypothetical protein
MPTLRVRRVFGVCFENRMGIFAKRCGDIQIAASTLVDNSERLRGVRPVAGFRYRSVKTRYCCA